MSTTWEEWNEVDQCSPCIVRGQRNDCEQSPCSVRHSWYVLQLKSENKQLYAALRTLIQAAKSMPEHPYTPAQNALDDAVEAAEKVVGEVAG